jgi:hypothetical protein
MPNIASLLIYCHLSILTAVFVTSKALMLKKRLMAIELPSRRMQPAIHQGKIGHGHCHAICVWGLYVDHELPCYFSGQL